MCLSFEENEKLRKVECNCHAKGLSYYHDKTCAVERAYNGIVRNRWRLKKGGLSRWEKL